uniref:Uncharacterized protein n=1 Tax=Plectus sambesii TaxID=2011161 RepID=A0A914WXV7_9BILA
MGESAFLALTIAVFCVLATSTVNASGAPCCKAFAFDTNSLLRTSEASLDIAELNFRQLRQVVALLDDVKTLRVQQLHAFEAWRKLCTEQVLGPTGRPGSPGPGGDKGAKGSQGKWGDIGPNGEVGKPGVHGAPGFEGVRGSVGATGRVGRDGPPGPIIRIKGLAGEVGPPGPPSRKRGPPGEKGYEGPRGRHGDMGEFGPVGPPSFCCQRSEHPQTDDQKKDEDHKDNDWKKDDLKEWVEPERPHDDHKDHDKHPNHSGEKKEGRSNRKDNDGGWRGMAHDSVVSGESSIETPLTTTTSQTNGSNLRRKDKDDGALLNDAPAPISSGTRSGDEGRRRARE